MQVSSKIFSALWWISSSSSSSSTSSIASFSNFLIKRSYLVKTTMTGTGRDLCQLFLQVKLCRTRTVFKLESEKVLIRRLEEGAILCWYFHTEPSCYGL